MNTESENRVTEQQREEEAIGRILQAAGRRPAMPEHTRRVWTDAFSRELRPVIRRRRRQHLSAAAAVVAMAVAALLYLGTQAPVTDVVPIARVMAMAGDGRVTAPEGTAIKPVPNMPLLAGTVLETGADSVMGIRYGGAVVRLNRLSRVRILQHRVELESGQLYVHTDTPPAGASALHGQSALVIHTPVAEVRDLGTQFRVAYNGRRLTSAVRKGIILVAAGNREYRARAEAGTAREISISPRGEVSEAAVSSRGAGWDWILAVAPRFEIEGKSLLAFLHWAETETGLVVEFAGSGPREEAGRTILRGDIGGLDPDQALDAVLATTRLRGEWQGRERLLIDYR